MSVNTESSCPRCGSRGAYIRHCLNCGYRLAISDSLPNPESVPSVIESEDQLAQPSVVDELSTNDPDPGAPTGDLERESAGKAPVDEPEEVLEDTKAPPRRKPAASGSNASTSAASKAGRGEKSSAETGTEKTRGQNPVADKPVTRPVAPEVAAAKPRPKQANQKQTSQKQADQNRADQKQASQKQASQKQASAEESTPAKSAEPPADSSPPAKKSAPGEKPAAAAATAAPVQSVPVKASPSGAKASKAATPKPTPKRAATPAVAARQAEPAPVASVVEPSGSIRQLAERAPEGAFGAAALMLSAALVLIIGILTNTGSAVSADPGEQGSPQVSDSALPSTSDDPSDGASSGSAGNSPGVGLADVVCWDGTQVAEVDECSTPVGREGLEWVFPGFTGLLDDPDAQCLNQTRFQPDTKPRFNARGWLLMWECDIDLVNGVGKVTFSQTDEYEAAMCWYDLVQYAKKDGGKSRKIKDGRKLKFTRWVKNSRADGWQITVLYADHPFAVTVQASTESAAYRLLAETQRREPSQVNGKGI